MELLDILAIIKVLGIVWISILVFVLYRYLKRLINKIPSIAFKDKKNFTIHTGHKKIRVRIK